MNILYKWLPRVFLCHCRDDRSFHYKGVKFPICARCTGELVGILSGIVLYPFIKLDTWVYFILMIPLITDGLVQLKTKYESNNIKRFITGILFGYSLVSLFIISTVYAYTLGIIFYQNM